VEELPGTVVTGSRATVFQPRLAVGLVLIAAGVLWAVARGLEFYGANLAYDLDQPPLMLLLVGAWLMYRSRLK
jgi:hypothetical protein